MEKETYGYARVSTISQHDDRQRLAMVEFGVEENFIFTDKQSGKDFDRPAYQALLDLIGTGDTLVVKSVSRFARNTVDSLSTIRKLKGVGCECYFEKEEFYTPKVPRIRCLSASFFCFGVLLVFEFMKRYSILCQNTKIFNDNVLTKNSTCCMLCTGSVYADDKFECSHKS